jgi:copper chaperone
MLAFEVNDMTCGHCVSTITKAIQAADPGAQVEIDLSTHRVQVQPVAGDEMRLAGAIAAAGYTPVATQAKALIPKINTPGRKGGCCCG